MKGMMVKHPVLLGVLAIVGAGATISSGQMSDGPHWPAPYIASDARISSVGDSISINGIPARIYRYTTGRKPEEVVRYFREHIQRDFSRAQPSEALPDQTAVAGRVGDFWVTLQLKQQDGQTVGTWSAVPQFVEGIRQQVQRPAGFPESAKLIQQVDSFDDGKRSQMAVGLDPSAVDGVAERLNEDLTGQGFIRQVTPQTPWPLPSTYVATYRKGREEILVTLSQEPTGTAVMVNRLSALEELQ